MIGVINVADESSSCVKNVVGGAASTSYNLVHYLSPVSCMIDRAI